MNTTVNSVVQLFLDRTRKASTQRFYENHLNLFLKHVGSLKLADLKAHHLTSLVDGYSGNYAHNIFRCVKTCFKWLVENEYIDRSPFAKLKAPPAVSRGDEAYIEPKRWVGIIGNVEGDLLDILTVLKETGCRPAEARSMEARYLHDQCIVFPKEISKGKQSQRVIHLSQTAWAILRRLTLKYPDGPLLRNKGKSWTAQSLANRCARFGFTAYQLRHSFCTNAILRGVDLVTIATLMGHADLKMISRVYGHIQRRDSHLQEALRRATA